MLPKLLMLWSVKNFEHSQKSPQKRELKKNNIKIYQLLCNDWDGNAVYCVHLT